MDGSDWLSTPLMYLQIQSMNLTPTSTCTCPPPRPSLLSREVWIRLCVTPKSTQALSSLILVVNHVEGDLLSINTAFIVADCKQSE